MDAKSDTADALVAEVAARQHGAVTRRQLEASGLGSKAITIRVRKGQLHRIHRGVYTVGHPALSPDERFMAAVLACGEGAVLSHGSAAVLWKLLKPLDGPIHISVPTTSGRRTRRGIHIHRTPTLAKPSPSPSSSPIRGGRGRRFLTTYRDNIPVTTVPRTIEDLRRTSFPSRFLRRAIRQAELMGYRLDGIETDRSRSDLETAFLDLWRQHHIPPPEVNAKLGRWEVDFLWRSQRLVVEADSWTYHRGSVAFEDDHTRDLDLRQQGYTVLRFTDRQLEEEPTRVARDVARALGSTQLDC
jgi:very-short-patch-repair endonuclease